MDDKLDIYKTQAAAFIAEINAVPAELFFSLQKSRNGGKDYFICPCCGSGTHSRGTGALRLYRDTNRVRCFAVGCRLTGSGSGEKMAHDNFGAYQLMHDYSYKEALASLGFVPDYDKNIPSQAKKVIPNVAARSEEQTAGKVTNEDLLPYYRECNARLINSYDADIARRYLHDRGITEQSIRHFLIGYDAKWMDAKSKYPSARIIVPRSRSCYLARAINPQNTAPKMIHGDQHTLFGAKTLTDESDTRPVIVTAGEFDAISVYQIGMRAVSINTDTNAMQFATVAAEKTKNVLYILALDSDRSGRQAQEIIFNALTEKNIPVISLDTAAIFGEGSDANAYLTTDERRAKFRQIITTEIEKHGK